MNFRYVLLFFFFVLLPLVSSCIVPCFFLLLPLVSLALALDSYFLLHPLAPSFFSWFLLFAFHSAFPSCSHLASCTCFFLVIFTSTFWAVLAEVWKKEQRQREASASASSARTWHAAPSARSSLVPFWDRRHNERKDATEKEEKTITNKYQTIWFTISNRVDAMELGFEEVEACTWEKREYKHKSSCITVILISHEWKLLQVRHFRINEKPLFFLNIHHHSELPTIE